MPSIVSNLRYGARSLLKSPGVTIIAVVALTLGIGLTTVMYSIVYGALIKGLPFDEADKIVSIFRSNPSQQIRRMSIPLHDFNDIRAQQHSFVDVAGYYTGTMNISGTEKAERFDGGFMTASAFDILRVRPILGRTFRQGEDSPGAERVAVIGYAMWKNRFGAAPNIVGTSVRINGEPTTIIGVMPEGFLFPERQELWIPVHMNPLTLKRGEGNWLDTYGRLKPGVTMEQASEDLATIANRIAKEYPKTNEGVIAAAEPFTKSFVGEEPTRLLYTMLGAVGFVLLIACANVANLLIGRAAFRSKEVGVRTALGASRGAIIGQFLAESAVLAAAGAVFGIALAWLGVRWFNDSLTLNPPPYWIDIKLHPPVLLFVLVLTLLTSFLAGVLPAVQASTVDINSVLKDESRGSSSFRVGRLSKGLVMFEIALSCGLLVAAGLMIKTVTKLRNVDYGFPTAELFTARVGLNESKYADSTKQVRFYEQLEARLASTPSTGDVSLSTDLPGIGSNYQSFMLEGTTYQKERDLPRAHNSSVTAGFFKVFGAKLISGRFLQPTDRLGTLPVAVVNQSFVKKFFPKTDPVGRRIRWGGLDSKQEWITIVGVTNDMWMDGTENRTPEGYYVPFAQHPERYASVIIHTRGDPNALTPLVRDAVASLDADQPIYFVKTLARRIAENNWHFGVFGSLFMAFGAAALFLASIGLYGVMSFSVSRRTREMGVRMALGAKTDDVLGLILKQGLLQIGVGMVFGLLMAFGLSRLLKIVLFDVQPNDLVVFSGVVITLTIAGIFACLIPARRATRIDPMVALRSD